MTSDSRLLCLGIFLTGLAFYPTVHAQQPATPPSLSSGTAPAPPPPTPAPQTDPYIQLLRESENLVLKGDLAGGLDKINAALRINPKGISAYVLRGSVYSQKKQYDLAEHDFETAHQIDPANPIVNFNLAEMKFVQKQYDAARPAFVALQKDKNEDVADLASYKVFLCDLFGNHASAAAQELNAFNQAGSKPSYFFANAASSLVNHNTEDARSWLKSAVNIYPPEKNELYAASLKDLGYLPLPPPPTR